MSPIKRGAKPGPAPGWAGTASLMTQPRPRTGSVATSKVTAVTGGAGPALDWGVPATGEDTVEVE
jgi:hypothetical protein